MKLSTYLDCNQKPIAPAQLRMAKLIALVASVLWLMILTNTNLYAAYPLPVGPDFQVHLEGGDDQTAPDVAKNDDGASVVVWHHGEVSQSIIAQRYDKFGIRVGDAITVTTDITSTTGVTITLSNPKVAIDITGNFVIVWQRSTEVGGDTDHDILAQRYNATGVEQGSVISVATENSNERNPDVAMDGDGNFVVVFEWQIGFAPPFIFMRRFFADGAWDSEGPVAPSATAVQSAPSVDMNNEGNFVVAYQHEDSAVPLDAVVVRRFISPTVQTGTPVTHTITTSTSSPDVGMADDGRYVLAWRDSVGGTDTIIAQRYDNVGATNGMTMTVSDSAGDSPAIAVQPDGPFVITWRTSGDDIVGKRYDADGNLLRTYDPIQINTTVDNAAPAVAVDACGDFLVAWEGRTFPGSDDRLDVYARLYASPKLTITKEVTPIGTIEASTQLTYTIRVSNTGAYTAASPAIHDTLDAYVILQDIISDTGTSPNLLSLGALVPTTLTLEVDEIAPNSSITITAVANVLSFVNPGQTITNTAVLTHTSLSNPLTATVTNTIELLPAISIDDVTVNEDAGVMTFTVSLDKVSTLDVDVIYKTTNNTAMASSDYEARSGSAFIPAGSLTAPIGIPIIDDELDEATETFFIDLSSPLYATIADNQGVGTILDNDETVLPCIRINDVSAVETAGALVFTVSLSESPQRTISVGYATADISALAPDNYTAQTGTLTFGPGQTQQSISIEIKNLAIIQGNRTFQVSLSGAANATICDGTGIGTIIDTTPTNTPTVTPTPLPTDTATPVPTNTATTVPTNTATPVPTNTATPVPTNTATPVPTNTATPVPTDTATPVPTDTATPVPTDMATPVPTDTATPVPTDAATPVPTDMATPVPTDAATPVPTNTSAPTPTPSPTPSPTPFGTPSFFVETDPNQPSVSYTGTVEEDSVTPGDIVHFILVYENTGPDTLINTLIDAFVPNDTTFVAEGSGLPPSVSAAGGVQSVQQPAQQPEGTVWELPDGGPCPTGYPQGAECRFRIGTLEPGTRGSLLYNARVDDDAPTGTIIILDSILRAENPAGNFRIELVLDTENFKSVSIVSPPQPVGATPNEPGIPTALEEMPEPSLLQHLFLPWVSR
ncbi:MAG: Calx-beta domain-containing protein [Chloroflexota bacterium]